MPKSASEIGIILILYIYMLTKAISHIMSFSDVKLDTCHHLPSLTLK